MAESLIPKHGGYRSLKSFQVAEVIDDLTVRFCDKYIDRGSRTRDQMIQAARSGRQNIAEGSVASGTSRKIELKLTGIAKASLEELRLDYEDYLRQHRFPLWDRNDPRRVALINARPRTADDVAAWAVEVKKSGRSEQGGQKSVHASRPSTGSTLSGVLGLYCGRLPRADPHGHSPASAVMVRGSPPMPSAKTKSCKGTPGQLQSLAISLI